MKLTVTIFSLILCTSLSAQKGNLLCKWIDGGTKETTIAPADYVFNKKSNIYYLFSNDNTNLYVDIKVEDSGIENRILKKGMVIWVNMDGKQDKKLGVHFPIGSETRSARRPNSPEPNFTPEGKPITPLMRANTIELIGFSNEAQSRFPADNPDSFRGSVKYDNDGNLVYKLLIPIAKLPVRSAKDGAGALPFNLAIGYGEDPDASGPGANMSRPPSGGGGAPSGAPSGGGGGGRSGGGGGAMPSGGGGMPGGGPGASQAAEPPVILWLKNVQLADKK
jgi:hypothetical protein